jgi:hypothetical protein
MRRPRLSSAVAVLALAVALVPTVVAADEKLEAEAAAKLNQLKKRLPGILREWHKNYPPVREEQYGLGEPEQKPYKVTLKLRFVRRTSPTTAKITFLLETRWPELKIVNTEQLISIYLSYYDGVWTTTGMEVAGFTREVEYARDQVRRYLMLAIDELDEK